jgi:hypothetical protein
MSSIRLPGTACSPSAGREDIVCLIPCHFACIATDLISASRSGCSELPGNARVEGDILEIDGSVMVEEKLPVGQFAGITIGDWRGYDLVAAR